MCNAITVDVEDWYHVCGLKETGPALREPRVLANVVRLLELFGRCGVKATFFVLGSVAEAEPTLVPMLVAAGHEVASHGYSHRLLPELGEQGLRQELLRTAEILTAQGAPPPVGFRAPQWSLTTATAWAYPLLAQLGYRYDSSRNPLPLVGTSRDCRWPYRVETMAGSLLELPPLVTPTPLGNLPTGGGWGFRFFPLRLICTTMKSLNRAGHPAVIYLHPREMEPNGPRLRLSPLRTFAVYGPRRSIDERLVELSRQFRFVTLGQLVDSCQSVC